MPSYIDLANLREIILDALVEDVGPGDVTSEATIESHTTASAVLKAKEDGIIAGLTVATLVVEAVDPAVTVTWLRQDGESVHSGETLGTISGNARSILKAERLALNFLQRMSGIATFTSQMVVALENSKTQLLDTRKTAPGLRVLDKWAVLLGGGRNHRVGLFDMILIKENHISASGGIENALGRAQKAKKEAGGRLMIEIEVTSLPELERVLAHGGADRVMLDNFVALDSGKVNTERLEQALALVGNSLETEASGNVTLETIGAIGRTGVTYVSSGALTHSVRALDLSLLITIDS